MYGDLPAKNAVYTPYIPINVWFWPTIHTYNASDLKMLQIVLVKSLT